MSVADMLGLDLSGTGLLSAFFITAVNVPSRILFEKQIIQSPPPEPFCRPAFVGQILNVLSNKCPISLAKAWLLRIFVEPFVQGFVGEFVKSGKPIMLVTRDIHEVTITIG